jgi:hypothetical protein
VNENSFKPGPKFCIKAGARICFDHDEGSSWNPFKNIIEILGALRDRYSDAERKEEGKCQTYGQQEPDPFIDSYSS